MSKVGMSTSKGFHEDARLIEIKKTFSGLVRNTPVVVGALPYGRTIADLVGIRFNSANCAMSAWGGNYGSISNHFDCTGMSGLVGGCMILEWVAIETAADGDNFTFAVTDAYSCNSDGTENDAINTNYYGDTLFNVGTHSNITITFYFK